MVYYCISDTIQTIYVAVTLVYLAILQIIGIILAIQTRKVKIKLLNDSKYIAAVIYISSISLVLIAIVTIVPGIYINLIEAIFSGSLLVATTFSLGLIFIPKVRTCMYCIIVYVLSYMDPPLYVHIPIINTIMLFVSMEVCWTGV